MFFFILSSVLHRPHSAVNLCSVESYIFNELDFAAVVTNEWCTVLLQGPFT